MTQITQFNIQHDSHLSLLLTFIVRQHLRFTFESFVSRLNITFVRPPVATPHQDSFFSLHETPDVRLVGAAPNHKTRVEKSNNVIFSSDLIATTLGMGQMRFMSKTYLNSILLVHHSQASSSPLLPMHYYFYLLHFLTRQLRFLL